MNKDFCPEIGDLVLLQPSYPDGAGGTVWGDKKVGIVTDLSPRWPTEALDTEMNVTILFTDSGEEETWSQYDVEVVNEVS